MTTPHQTKILESKMPEEQASELVHALFDLEIPPAHLYQVIATCDLNETTQAQIDDLILNDYFLDKITVNYTYRPNQHRMTSITISYDAYNYMDISYASWKAKSAKICYAFLNKIKDLSQGLDRFDKARIKCLRGLVWAKLIEAQHHYRDTISHIPEVILTEIQRGITDPTRYAPKSTDHILEKYESLSMMCKRDILSLDAKSPLIPFMVYFNLSFFQLSNKLGLRFLQLIDSTSKTRARCIISWIATAVYGRSRLDGELVDDYAYRISVFEKLTKNGVIVSSKYLENIPWFRNEEYTNLLLQLSEESLTSSEFLARATEIAYSMHSSSVSYAFDNINF